LGIPVLSKSFFDFHAERFLRQQTTTIEPTAACVFFIRRIGFSRVSSSRFQNLLADFG
jgi:hypothetical protein